MRFARLPVVWAFFAPFAAATGQRQSQTFATAVSSSTASSGSYDFIIAGGGISGLTIADRLTEDPSVSVLVPGAFFPVPYLWIPLPSVPQAALNGRSFNWPAGKVVGGGSVVNGMVFVRPEKEELETWSELGATGWTWEDMLPYYKKSENFTAPDPAFERQANFSHVPEAHGYEGPVQTSFPNFFFPGSGHWYEAAVSSGLRPVDDPQTGSSSGVVFFPTVADYTSRTRSHARLNHHERARQRPNYHILPEHTVSRVLFDKEKAVGVEYLPTSGGALLIAKATKEVLVASGALHTPQVLQLSGIGPRALLDKLGIPVVSDLPGVGANFHDQPSIIIPYNVTNNVVPNTGTLNTNATYDAEQRKLYDDTRTGPYVITRGLSTNLARPSLCKTTSQCAALLAAARANDPLRYLPQGTHPTVANGYLAQRAKILSQLEGDTPVAMISWNTADAVRMYFLKPLSRGTVAINSTDPLAHPLIDFRTLADPVDFDLVVAAFLKNRQIMAQPAMRALNPLEAGPFGEGITDEAELKRVLAGVAEPSAAHQCCTAAMMPKHLGGVVNPEMEVYGVTGLRVVDTSFWPVVLTAAPTATTYAAAEKIADVIKKKYHLHGRDVSTPA